MTMTTKEWLAANPPPDSAFKQTLATVAERVRAGGVGAVEIVERALAG